MYGYNAAIHVANNNAYDRLFYGATVGFGIDVSGNPRKGHLSRSNGTIIAAFYCNFLLYRPTNPVPCPSTEEIF